MIGSSSRMLALLSLLQMRRDWPGSVLADRLEVTPRTVRRDIGRLRELGYRITATKGPDGGYQLAAGSELPPLLFDDEQAVAVAVALQSAAGSGVDLGDAASRALASVRQVMPSRLRHRIDGIRFETIGTATAVDPAALSAVSEAVRSDSVLRFDYGAESDGPPRRTEPHALVARAGRWYLVAWDLDRGDWRTFRLDRMSPRHPTGPRFTRRALPAGDAATYLAAQFKGSRDDDRWPCVGSVVIDLPAHELAPWLPDAELEAVDEHSTRVTLGAWSWTGLVAAVLRFDAPFAILGPSGFAEAAAALADRLTAGGSEPRE
jgi:predicted DNA-binding transcriptional regulator YafY